MKRTTSWRTAVVALTLAALAPAPVSAETKPAATTIARLDCDREGDCGPIRKMGGSDWFFAFVLGEVGMVTGALAGAGAGLLVNDGFDFDGNTDNGWSSPISVGALLGATTGTAAMVYAYGEASGYDGSFLASYMGAAIGSGAVYALAQIEDDSPGLVIMSAFVLPAIGATIGYAFSIEDRIPDAPVGALLKFSDDRLQLGMPTVTYAPGDDTDYLGITLVDGTF